MKLFLALHSFVELDDTSQGNCHIVQVLSVGNVQYCRAALDLAGEEVCRRSTHIRGYIRMTFLTSLRASAIY